MELVDVPVVSPAANTFVLSLGGIKMAAFWDVVPCSLVGIYRHFRAACCHRGSARVKHQ
jgi:hypothetical protein